MRSRYSAHVKLAIPYLVSTVAEKVRHHHQAAQIHAWASKLDWKRLQIVDTKAGKGGDAQGIVEFRAWYTDQGELDCLHERSNFVCENGKWFYVDGKHDGKDWRKLIGRNDPCPCGSGKKFKKCHG